MRQSQQQQQPPQYNVYNEPEAMQQESEPRGGAGYSFDENMVDPFGSKKAV